MSLRRRNTNTTQKGKGVKVPQRRYVEDEAQKGTNSWEEAEAKYTENEADDMDVSDWESEDSAKSETKSSLLDPWEKSCTPSRGRSRY